MATEKVKRKLTAILSADVKGYSRLMGVDEVGTIRTLETYRGVMSDLIRKKGGRVVDAPGDNVLAEFASVVDALESAVEIQRELKVRNADRSESRRMEFRIGINLGDVVEEGERIYGDGVNIAARIEGLAEGGGICISGTACDHIGKRLALGYEYMGEQAVKNIEKPVRVYRVLMEPEAAGRVIGEEGKRPKLRSWKAAAMVVLLALVAGGLVFHFYGRGPKIEPASKEKMAFPLPDKPSIAVLPFINMSDDPKQEFFADGLAEEIINALSKLPQVFVIGRNSTFTYKAKPVKVQQVAEELGVQYVLEGSVRREENRLRITAQLIDALTGRHLFSERYDRTIKEIFATQDEIAIKILTALRTVLKDEQWASFHARGVSNVDAYFKLLEASNLTQKVNKEDNSRARRLAEEALALEPQSSRAHHVLAVTHFWDYWLGPPKSPEDSTERGIEMASKAIALDEYNSAAHALLAMLYINKGDYDRAVESGERAASMDPNSAIVLTNYGSTFYHACRTLEAIPVLEKVLRLTPVNPPTMALANLGSSHRMLGQYDEAVRYYQKLLKDNPRHFAGNLGLIATYVLVDRLKDAEILAEQYLKTNPKFSLQYFARTIRQKDPAEKDRFLQALRKAGLPEKPPLPLPDKPSIAVLPFVNMSEDKSQEFFSDGMTEEIINALTKLPQILVIARNSSFTYKGRAVDVRQIGREMGVKYILEGSVRRGGDRVRITAQLVDASTGNHLFSERYERDLRDIFALQDEITMKVLTAIQVKLTDGEQARVYARGTKLLDAYLGTLEARELVMRLNSEDNALARRKCEEVVVLDPQYARAWALLSTIYLMDFQWGIDSELSLKKAREAAQKAISLDGMLAAAHMQLGFLYAFTRKYEEGVAESECAVQIDPGVADVHANLGRVLEIAGRPREALGHLEKAMRMNPIPPPWYWQHLGFAHMQLEQYEKAVDAFKRTLAIAPKHIHVLVGLTSAYALMGRIEDARSIRQQLLRVNPRFNPGRARAFYKDETFNERLVEGLDKAGLLRDSETK